MDPQTAQMTGKTIFILQRERPQSDSQQCIMTMSSNWSKITRHVRKQRYVIHSQEKKNHSIEIDREMTEIMELEDK